jgi:PEGA domain
MSHSVSRSDLFAALVAAALMAAGGPALAKKKAAPASHSNSDPFEEPRAPAAEKAAPQKASQGAAEKAAEKAAQAGDQERPKPILEEAPGPEADEKGNVNFIGKKVGKGKITVNAPVTEKAKVYLEGRYFGTAPRTINGIPPGDYIVEVSYPDGKSVTRPVAVSGEEETVIELGMAADVAGPAEKPMEPEKVEKRLNLAKMIGIGAVALLVVGGGLAIWEYTVQKDYDKKIASSTGTSAERQQTDDLAHKGERLALIANISFGVAAAGLIAAGIIGYPAWKARGKSAGRSETPDAPPPMSFIFGPGRTLGSVNAGMVYRF